MKNDTTFKKLALLPKALPVLLCIAAASAHAEDAGSAFTSAAIDYRTESSLFASMGDRTRGLIDGTMQNFRVFNQRLARSLDYTDLRMSALDLPAPDNWDYEYWDHVNQTKSFVTPTSDGVMLELQIKYR